ncbi:DUF7115 domain-containing protein [Halorussus amylolyticus]|uniref:DUF7115 domain-containing protein n=1 Tax=Halorussus amylolyticus TaxID=1126242 RepID=UPI001049DA15|nr:hypothetical protein [Halorussus amylolyticus]
MSVPGIVQSRLDGEQVAAQVPLGGEDVLFVTPSRTLIYRADGLLSDESVEEYSHDAERIEISDGRRKAAVQLDFGIDGTEKFKVPSSRLYEALHPVLAGVLNAAGVTGPDETVTQTYQFSELTLVITSDRVVKHVGAAVWDEDYEEFRFEDVTRLDVEEGNVSSQIIIESAGRPQRIKTPSDQTREVRERIERALLDYHGVSSYEEFAREVRDPETESDAETEGEVESASGDDRADPLAGGVDPIEANPPELDDDGAIIDDDAGVTTGERPGDEPTTDPTPSGEPVSAEADSDDAVAHANETESATADASVDTDGWSEETTASGFADSGFEPASSELEADDTDVRLEALTEAVERQNELLAAQQRTLEQLVEELSRGR